VSPFKLKAIEQYFLVVLFLILYKVILTFTSVDGIIVFKMLSSRSAFHNYLREKLRLGQVLGLAYSLERKCNYLVALIILLSCIYQRDGGIQMEKIRPSEHPQYGAS